LKIGAFLETGGRCLLGGMPLYPDAIVSTGTPEEMALSDDHFLLPDDVVRCEVEGLGALESAVVPVGDDEERSR